MLKKCEYCGDNFKTELSFKIYCCRDCAEKGPMSKSRYGGLHYYVLKRDGFKCTECGEVTQLHVHHKDENIQNNTMSNLITLCQSCHKHIHHHGENNNHYKHISKDQVSKAIEVTSNLEEAANLLGITRKTLMKKRLEYGLPNLPNSRKGEENPRYKPLTINEINMAFELEGNWSRAAERLGVSPSFLRKRRRELGMEMDAKKTSHKNLHR
jgi:DNA-binding protein Fis